MAKETGIKWTDSTYNSWWGCTKVGPACDHCYAEGVDKRTGENHWGHGAPRKLLSEHTRNEPIRWNRAHDKFFAEHGRKRRVFTLSMGDLFDNEVPAKWRHDHFEMMEKTPNLEWQICTKRVSNIKKMVEPHWTWLDGGYWPDNVGVLITIVTQAEADRDIPRLLELKRIMRIPWVGISYEPAQEAVDFSRFMSSDPIHVKTYKKHGRDRLSGGPPPSPDGLDVIIFGGKSGPQWNDRPFSLNWAYRVADDCAALGCSFFFKQVAAFRPTDDMIPADLMIRQWPKGH